MRRTRSPTTEAWSKLPGQRLPHLDAFETFWHDGGAGLGKGVIPMRGVAALTISLGLVATLTACGGGDGGEPTSFASPTPITPPQPRRSAGTRTHFGANSKTLGA